MTPVRYTHTQSNKVNSLLWVVKRIEYRYSTYYFLRKDCGFIIFHHLLSCPLSFMPIKSIKLLTMWLLIPQTTLVRVPFVSSFVPTLYRNHLCPILVCVFVRGTVYTANCACIGVCLGHEFPDNTTILTFTLYQNDSIFLAEAKNTRSP